VVGDGGGKLNNIAEILIRFGSVALTSVKRVDFGVLRVEVSSSKVFLMLYPLCSILTNTV